MESVLALRCSYEKLYAENPLELNSNDKLECLKNVINFCLFVCFEISSFVDSYILKIKLSDLLKQMERGGKSNDLSQLIELFGFLLDQLHRATSKDVIRKLFVRCCVSISRALKTSDALIDHVKPKFFAFLNDDEHHFSIGQRLFILNIYLENLDEFGAKFIYLNRLSVLKFLLSLLDRLKTDLK